MFKKLIIASFVLSSSTMTFASITSYVGGSLGVSGYNSQPGTIANLFGGTGTTVGQNQNIYLGGELNASVAHYSNYKMAYGLSASFIPGVILAKDTMLYGRVGMGVMHSQSTINHDHGAFTNYGLLYGAGVQTKLINNWDIRGDYTYANAGNSGQYTVGLVYKTACIG
jgi:opacity protein-like surface antigen